MKQTCTPKAKARARTVASWFTQRITRAQPGNRPREPFRNRPSNNLEGAPTLVAFCAGGPALSEVEGVGFLTSPRNSQSLSHFTAHAEAQASICTRSGSLIPPLTKLIRTKGGSRLAMNEKGRPQAALL